MKKCSFYFFLILFCLAVCENRKLIEEVELDQQDDGFELEIGIITDVHLDLEYDPYIPSSKYCHNSDVRTDEVAHFGRQGCDSSYRLMKSTISQMKEITPQPDLILVPGDLSSHQIPLHETSPFKSENWELMKNTVKNLTFSLRDEFQETPLIFSIGNNDVLWHYQVPKKDFKKEFYQFYYDTWITQIPANARAVIISHILTISGHSRKSGIIHERRLLFISFD
jgi:hypothetical protein